MRGPMSDYWANLEQMREFSMIFCEKNYFYENSVKILKNNKRIQLLSYFEELIIKLIVFHQWNKILENLKEK